MGPKKKKLDMNKKGTEQKEQETGSPASGSPDPISSPADSSEANSSPADLPDADPNAGPEAYDTDESNTVEDDSDERASAPAQPGASDDVNSPPSGAMASDNERRLKNQLTSGLDSRKSTSYGPVGYSRTQRIQENALSSHNESSSSDHSPQHSQRWALFKSVKRSERPCKEKGDLSSKCNIRYQKERLDNLDTHAADLPDANSSSSDSSEADSFTSSAVNANSPLSEAYIVGSYESERPLTNSSYRAESSHVAVIIPNPLSDENGLWGHTAYARAYCIQENVNDVILIFFSIIFVLLSLFIFFLFPFYTFIFLFVGLITEFFTEEDFLLFLKYIRYLL